MTINDFNRVSSILEFGPPAAIASSSDGQDFPQVGPAHPYFDGRISVLRKLDARTARPAFQSTQLLDALALHAGAMLIDDHGRLRFANRLAAEIIDRRNAFMTDATGHLRCRDRIAQKKLEGMIGRLKNNSSRAFGLLVPCADRAPIVAILSPLGSMAEAPASILVMLRDPDHVRGIGTALLRDLYDLTHAEAAVVTGIVLGRKVTEIAGQRGVAIDTVRCQLKTARSKIGADSLTDLVLRVLRAVAI